MVSEMNSLSSSVRTTLTNDQMRNLFKRFLLSHVKDFETLYKFGKLKGWEEVAPAYKTSKQGLRESLSVSEAYHIWHNINDRYIQSQLTSFFLVFVHDLDFKLILTKGVNVLKKQIQMMEQEALNGLRKIFLDLYKAELDIQDDMIKYGEMKGWAKVPPIYVEPT